MRNAFAKRSWVIPIAWRSSLSAISAIIFCVLASERARAPGDIFASSSRKFLAIEQSLPSECFQMFVVQPIGHRHKLLVPTALARFVPTNQQNCSASRIEGEQDTIGSSSMLNAQFLHVGVLRGRYGVHMGPAKRRPEAAKQAYLSPYLHLFGFAQTFPPRPKFICKLYFPFLRRNIPPKAYSVKSTPQCRALGTIPVYNASPNKSIDLCNCSFSYCRRWMRRTKL